VSPLGTRKPAHRASTPGGVALDYQALAQHSAACRPQQLYQVIVAVNASALRAHIPGTDAVGHARLSN
jgi:hypothetical protein